MLGERMGWSFLPATVGLLAGGYLTLFGLAAPGTGFSAWGLALAVLSAVVWGYYTVVLRRTAPGLPIKPLMGASFLLGTAYFLGLALVVEGPPAVLHQAPETWGWMALHVAFPSLAAFILFTAALQRAPASLVNLLVGAELGFTALFAWLLFGVGLAADQLAGLGLVLGSVTAYLWGRSRVRPAATGSA
jgi:drug/metabolite transporter (DMT)-like permease